MGWIISMGLQRWSHLGEGCLSMHTFTILLQNANNLRLASRSLTSCYLQHHDHNGNADIKEMFNEQAEDGRQRNEDQEAGPQSKHQRHRLPLRGIHVAEGKVIFAGQGDLMRLVEALPEAGYGRHRPVFLGDLQPVGKIEPDRAHDRYHHGQNGPYVGQWGVAGTARRHPPAKVSKNRKLVRHRSCKRRLQELQLLYFS